jgi:hypothetical protein
MDKIFLPDELVPLVSRSRESFSRVSENVHKSYESREDFRSGVSWHVPTQFLIELMARYSPLVSVGCGFAYTESLAIEQGVDVIPTDLSPNITNQWCRKGKFFCEVEEADSVFAVNKYKDRNVFMAWPPYDTSMAYDTALAMYPGQYLIYIGEGYGGCNGDDLFFEYLNDQFEEVDNLTIPQWFGLHDYCTVYRKKSKK